MNTIKKNTLLFCGILLTVFLYSCTEDFNDLNTDPSLINEDTVNPDILFTRAQRAYIYTIPNLSGRIDEYSGYYANQASGNIFLNTSWGWPYDDYLINNEEVIRLTDGDPVLANKNAMARIWKIYLFHPVTDAFGDVPYSEAFKGIEASISQPVYDSQAEIYESMLNELRDAAAALQVSDDRSSFGSADLIYGGDAEMWRRFANSLRLRLAIRIRYADEELARQHISEVIDAPLLDDNAQNPTFTTEGEEAADNSNRNPVFNRYSNENAQPLWSGYTLTSTLNERDDPRLPIFSKVAEDTVSGYNGRPIQLQSGQDSAGVYTSTTTASLGDYFTKAEFTVNLMHHAGVQFLKAEAYLTGLAPGDAQAAFQEGIRASMEYYEVDEGDIADYIAAQGMLPTDEEEALEEIIVQKYFANFLLTEEAWAEYRRTGYPLMYFGSEEGVTGGELPRRKTYPELEYSVNGQNVRDAASRLEGGDEMMSRIWWDTKPGLPYAHPAQGTFPPPK